MLFTSTYTYTHTYLVLYFDIHVLEKQIGSSTYTNTHIQIHSHICKPYMYSYTLLQRYTRKCKM